MPLFRCCGKKCYAEGGSGAEFWCHAESKTEFERLCQMLDGERREPLDFDNPPMLYCSTCATPTIAGRSKKISASQWNGLFSITLVVDDGDDSEPYAFPHSFSPRDTLSAVATTIKEDLRQQFDRTLGSRNFGQDFERLGALARKVEAQECTIHVRRAKDLHVERGRCHLETRTYETNAVHLTGATTLARARIFSGDLITFRFPRRTIDETICAICQDALPEAALTLQCGHKFCVECLKEHHKHSSKADTKCPTCQRRYDPRRYVQASATKRRKTEK